MIDAGNYYPERDGQFVELELGNRTSSELVAKHLPGTRVVKAFNTIYYKDLAEQGDPDCQLNNAAQSSSLEITWRQKQQLPD